MTAGARFAIFIRVESIPTGTVSFLFSDVEGSTRLWEADPEGMAASLALHDATMRSIVGGFDGHVFSTAGDAFAVAFDQVEAAVGAALQAQLELAAARWPGPSLRVRMGLHTGTAEERDGDYFGPVLNRAARIMAAGHGGQVLLSSVTVDLLPAREAHTLVDLGSHHLKDLSEPEQLFELRHPGLPAVTAPLRTSGTGRSNLHERFTSFVGRSEELVAVQQAVREHRLVVLTGVGGTGKTRLALEAAGGILTTCRDGAWLVELAPVSDRALVMTAIGEVWGLRAGEGAGIDEVVLRFLRAKQLLLLVDNCEHLLDAAAETVQRILEAAPRVRVLATSRESLGIPGERVLRVPSLGLPDDGDPQRSDSVRLFLDRARTVRTSYEPDDEELAAISRICRRVDGIPLALELAAARLRSLTAQELTERLEDSFRVLSGSKKAALPRQRTLHATISWSHDLLDPREQAVFRRSSSFVGGFDLSAAEAVCAGAPVEDGEVLDLLDALVGKSLAVPTHSSVHGTRYRMLEPVRQYAQEQLAASQESAAIRAAHARHFRSAVADASPHTRGPDQMSWDRMIDRDYDNIRAAFVILLEQGETDLYLDMAFDLFSYWMHTGKQVEAMDVLIAGLEAAPASTAALRLSRAWWVAAVLGAEITDPRSVGYARSGLGVAEAAGDRALIARMHLALGAAIRHTSDDPEYLDHLVESRRLLEVGPSEPWWEPAWDHAVLEFLQAAYLPAEDGRRREHFASALGTFEQLGDEAMLAAALTETVAFIAEDEAWVFANVQRAVQILDRIEVPYWAGHALMYLGILLGRRGEHALAVDHQASARAHLEDCGDIHCWAAATRDLAASSSALGRQSEAAAMLAQVVRTLPELPMQQVSVLRTLDAAVQVLTAWGSHEEAAVTLGLAMAVEFPEGPDPLDRDALHEAARTQIEGRLGAAETERLIAEGTATEPDEGFEQLLAWLDPS